MTNAMQINDKELNEVNGSLFKPDNPVCICSKCGKRYKMAFGHECLVFLKMDIDNRPPIDHILHKPVIPQE